GSRGWIHLHFFEEAERKTIGRRETADGDRNQTRHIRIYLRQRDSRLEACHTWKTEIAQFSLTAVPLHGEVKSCVFSIEEMKILWQHTDDFARLAIHDDRLAND